jgi:transcriptional antiterminator RfaH
MSPIVLRPAAPPKMGALSTPTSEAWYVLQTKPRQELRAREHLENQGFRCVLPLIRVEKIRRRVRQWVDEPLFARYLFIRLGGADARWNVLRSTRGVSQVVRFGGVPAKVPSEWMIAFLSRDRAPVRLFDTGQRVVVTDGPFAGLEGVYKLPDGETRAIVLLELLGKPCAGTFPVEALKRVA